MTVVSLASANSGVSSIDEAIAQHIVELFKQKHKIDLNTAKNSSKALYRIRKEANNIKELLSTIPKATVNLEVLYDGLDFRADITRETFEKLSTDLLDQIQKTILEAVGDNTYDYVEVIGGGQSKKNFKIYNFY